MEQLKSEIIKNHFDIVIIDTYDLFFPMDKEDDNGKINKNIIGPLLTIARGTGVAIILVHHCSKGALERDKTQRGRGASVLNNHAHVLINLETTQDEEILKLDVVKNRFMPNVCVYLKKVCGEFEVVDRPDYEFTKTQLAEKCILKVLEKGEQQLKDILYEVENMGISEKTGRLVLTTLQTSGKIIRSSYGKYCEAGNSEKLPSCQNMAIQSEENLVIQVGNDLVNYQVPQNQLGNTKDDYQVPLPGFLGSTKHLKPQLGNLVTQLDDKDNTSNNKTTSKEENLSKIPPPREEPVKTTEKKNPLKEVTI
ncbi:AAA family ATPase [Atribacter laminatus]|uniref:AAA domain-containing protein n=1 Tax=Atribacter laminatus TaxID=2847778 RepID=A0A7T1F3Y7_ATRLM|nr:AAA family ATPase [Atribacter laminatus]QPM68866.1 hypothetical protein RT761_02093 [Atribacter laminatus]